MATEENAESQPGSSSGAGRGPEGAESHEPQRARGGQTAPEAEEQQRDAQGEDPTSPARGFDDIEDAAGEQDE